MTVSGSEIHPRDRWFDDWAVGEVFVSETSFVMVEEKMIAFAQEFDPQPFHTDPKLAADTFYGGLIASGWHTGSAMMRLITEFVGEASMGSPGCDEMRWIAPVKAGDELRLRLTVEEVRASASKPDRGIVRCRQELFRRDRDGSPEVVMSLVSALMMRRRT